MRDLTHRSRARRAAAWASVLVLALVLTTWFVLSATSEEFIPATLLVYGPRWLVLLPIAVASVGSLFLAPSTLLLHAISAGIALGPVMGARIHPFTGRSPIPPASAAGLRVMSLNAQGGAIAAQYLPEALHSLAPDLVSLQECGDSLAATLARTTGYHLARHTSLCVLSRWPLSAPDSMPRAAFERVASLGYGGTGLVVRYRVAHPEQPLDFITLHLETPRKGLERLIGADGIIPDGGGLPAVDDPEGAQINARIRRMESERASVWARRSTDSLPLIVAGDFNMPVESAIYRQFWSVFGNAFERAGLGFGYTKTENRFIRARIDHVLYATRWFEAVGAWVGPDVGSDHRPVVADLLLVR